MKMGHIEIRSRYDCHLERSQLQESSYLRDLDIDILANLSPENYSWKTADEVNYISVDVRNDFKNMDKLSIQYQLGHPT